MGMDDEWGRGRGLSPGEKHVCTGSTQGNRDHRGCSNPGSVNPGISPGKWRSNRGSKTRICQHPGVRVTERPQSSGHRWGWSRYRGKSRGRGAKLLAPFPHATTASPGLIQAETSLLQGVGPGHRGSGGK